MKLEMKLESKFGRYFVDIISNGTAGYIAIANVMGFDAETMSKSSYWFTIGNYKTLKGAIRSSIKRMAEHGIELVVA